MKRSIKVSWRQHLSCDLDPVTTKNHVNSKAMHKSKLGISLNPTSRLKSQVTSFNTWRIDHYNFEPFSRLIDSSLIRSVIHFRFNNTKEYFYLFLTALFYHSPTQPPDSEDVFQDLQAFNKLIISVYYIHIYTYMR